MGDNPDTAVCDRWGRVHQWDNVVVADSSVFPTASGYGPTLTLVALGVPGRPPPGRLRADGPRPRRHGLIRSHGLSTSAQISAPRSQPGRDRSGNRGGEG